MRILIDIAHPAHIHYFRNFAYVFEQNGHQCLFTVRDKGIIVELANYYKLNFKIRSTEKKNKLLYALLAIKSIYLISKKFKPDIFLDFGTVFAAPVSKILGKPYIAFDDTEAATKSRFFHMPFTNVVITPDIFYINLGRKQIRMKSLMELMYLHKSYFKKSKEELLPYFRQISNFVLLRFVSWEAHHDVGNRGISYEKKIELINYLKEKYEVIISSEGKLPESLEEYQMKAPPHLIHQILAQAKFVISEGATIASESVFLGTPVIYINSIQNGYSIEQKEKGVLFSLDDDKNLLQKVQNLENNIVLDSSGKEHFLQKSNSYIHSKIDPTKFLLWFVEHYPQSFKIMKENPEYQERFR